MEIIQSVGPDCPVILTREPQLVARDMKQLQAVDAEDEVFLQPQLILALYSSQIHLKVGETISFAHLFACDDDAIFVVVDTNIEPTCDAMTLDVDCDVSARAAAPTAVTRGARKLPSLCEPECVNEVPEWLRHLSGYDAGSSSLAQQESIELTCLRRSTTEGDSHVPSYEFQVKRRPKRLLCCLIL